MAAANEHITADAIEATEFMELSRRYRVNGVPKTVVVNRNVELLGALPEDEFVEGILAGAGPDPSGDGREPVSG